MWTYKKCISLAIILFALFIQAQGMDVAAPVRFVNVIKDVWPDVQKAAMEHDPGSASRVIERWNAELFASEDFESNRDREMVALDGFTHMAHTILFPGSNSFLCRATAVRMAKKHNVPTPSYVILDGQQCEIMAMTVYVFSNRVCIDMSVYVPYNKEYAEIDHGENIYINVEQTGVGSKCLVELSVAKRPIPFV